MGCYSNKVKYRCSKVVLVVSILAIVLGLFTTIFGFAKSGIVDELT